jgi:hypothetical protein
MNGCRALFFDKRLQRKLSGDSQGSNKRSIWSITLPLRKKLREWPKMRENFNRWLTLHYSQKLGRLSKTLDIPLDHKNATTSLSTHSLPWRSPWRSPIS